VWDPEQYNNASRLSVPHCHIWTPDFKLINALSEVRDTGRAVVMSNGNVFWVPSANYKTRCSKNKNKESYHCTLSLGSWTYDAASLPISLFVEGIDTRLYSDTCPYAIAHARASIKHIVYAKFPNTYPQLRVEFDVVKRKGLLRDEDKDEVKPKLPTKDCHWPRCR